MLKLTNAQKVGAKAVVIYTDTMNGTTGLDVLTNNTVLPVAFINNDAGRSIFHSIRKNEAPKGQFTNILVALNAPASDIDSIGGFSSLGPTNELQLKPELVAVGGNVFSTLPRYLKSYGFRSGTSMSAPFISASVSLVLSKFKDRKIAPQEMKDLFMNFARTGNYKFLLIFISSILPRVFFFLIKKNLHIFCFIFITFIISAWLKINITIFYSKTSHFRFTLW